ncbi:velvet factor-domain-containing protein [Gilbertella persicaria]|uniref:velvet factor-domain-containing protein n=1 Tax=Gilbertella persicaria TaxID=101096 RepID=UPI00221F4CCC|nr:velvet factor-domain-containing protein [Gilbertella persicaria]KAI8075360.1 velvet factor-domain-containing protein [Gilbertella persicaria]
MSYPYDQKQFLCFNKQNNQYALTVRQQPKRARLCSFKDKVDRRPLDPPPIVQLHQINQMNFSDYQNSANLFLHATLVNANGQCHTSLVNGNRTLAGSMAQSLNKLRDTNNIEGAFFIFADISVRIEGTFRLKFTLFCIQNDGVEQLCHTVSEPFRVYSPKTFPGMSESTALTRSFSEQGVRVRIRKEAREPPKKRPRKMADQHHDHRYEKTMTNSSHLMSIKHLLIQDHSSKESYFNRYHL